MQLPCLVSPRRRIQLVQRGAGITKAEDEGPVFRVVLFGTTASGRIVPVLVDDDGKVILHA
jgi:predicted nucleotidyltransferase